MSTPPPPNQPPAGGFGAPQDPHPGGFGAPQPGPPVPPAPPQQPPVPPTMPAAPAVPPQGQPAYGYPQQGYGYPQQQPAPDAGAPPQFGAPTAPMQAARPPAPGGGNAKRTQLMIVGAAVVAVSLIVGAGFWSVSGDDGDGKQPTPNGSQSTKAQAGTPGSEKAPANVKSKPLFNQPSPTPEDVVNVEGSWLTDSTYVKSDVAKVVGYNTVDGGKKWEIPFPGELCGATKHVSDNKTAVLFRPAKPTPEVKYPACTEVGVIDLNAGKLLWSGNAKGATTGDKPALFDEVTISGQTVAAGGTSGGAAWNLADGKSLWTPKTDGEGCYDSGYAGGEALGVIRKCGRGDNQTLYAQTLDPATGAQTASYKLSPGIEWASIVSTKPLIVAADVGKAAKNASGVSDLFVVDPKGELKARISLASGNFGGKCNGTDVEKCYGFVVGNGKLYLPSIEHQGKESGGDTNELLSFDLETGKETTDRADAGEKYTLFPLRMDGSNVIAYKEPPYDKGGQIVSIDGTTMKETVLMENPAEKASRTAETGYSPDYSEYRYHNGKLFISRTMARKPYSDKGDPEYLFVSFSAS
ncbi:PQQ-binding-like beta-propeller repeat protein [Streptomyces sp. NBC_00320]|uniref:outer membrane protein assembly factor BamB family protein n=1 Tax=Streptomyces sp. NBC_00320 TaxID=2975711 RepID=UPI0022584328|nr:PQQ-binding-like beta-propeller repeat protein [Streptomyces sp. NBC_00320]MCX5147325.1 PQQ-binding-like beta-propeller repeat protein [Streptomyces sp. NBC_00320]